MTWDENDVDDHDDDGDDDDDDDETILNEFTSFFHVYKLVITYGVRFRITNT